MTTATVVFRLNESHLFTSPFVNQLSNDFTRNGGLIDQRNQYSLGLRANSLNSTCDRCAHLAIRIGIDSELDVKIFQLLRTSSARWPTTTMMSSIPVERRLSRQDSITVLSPKGSSGLNAPIRRERPAASRIAATLFMRLWWVEANAARPLRLEVSTESGSDRVVPRLRVATRSLPLSVLTCLAIVGSLWRALDTSPELFQRPNRV